MVQRALNYEPLESDQDSEIYERLKFSLQFVINYTPQHCGAEEVREGGGHLITNR